MTEVKATRKTPTLGWLLVAAILFSELFAQWWFSPEQQSWAHTPRLTLHLPDPASNSDPAVGKSNSDSPAPSETFSFHPQPERLSGAVTQLSYSDAACGIFFEPETLASTSPALDLFYFEYETGNSRFIHDVFGHAPEVCMSSTGAKLRKTHPTRDIEVDGQSIPVRVLEFESPLLPQPLWVFRITWLPEDAPFQAADSASSLRREKVLAAFYRNPRPPARVVLAGALNFDGLDSAWSAFESLVVSRLAITKPQRGNVRDYPAASQG